MNYIFTAPDYFPAFSCKGGACRTSCCRGWRVTFSREEYFRLLGEEASPELRRRLDCSLHVLRYAEPEEYAEISHNYLGECPLQREDGLCALHAECGEFALCDVCRLFPRGVHTHFANEVSCSAACEALIETFMHRHEPLHLITIDYDPRLPEAPHGDIPENYLSERNFCLETLTDRSIPMEVRLTRLAQRYGTELPETPEAFFDRLINLHRVLSKESASVSEYLEPLEPLLNAPNAFKHCTAERRAFLERFPDFPILEEHLLINHAFYESFPYADARITPAQDALALITVCAYARLISLPAKNETELTDILAAVYRFTEHTPFHYNAALLMR